MFSIFHLVPCLAEVSVAMEHGSTPMLGHPKKAQDPVHMEWTAHGGGYRAPSCLMFCVAKILRQRGRKKYPSGRF